jgi:hypothetical protein
MVDADLADLKGIVPLAEIVLESCQIVPGCPACGSLTMAPSSVGH